MCTEMVSSYYFNDHALDESGNLEASLSQAALGPDLDYFVNTEKDVADSWDSSLDVSLKIYSLANYHSARDEDSFSTAGCHGGARFQSLPKHSASNGEDDGQGENLYAALPSAPPTKKVCVKSPSIQSPSLDKAHDRTSSCKTKTSSSSKSESKTTLRTATRKARPYSSQAAGDNVSQSATKRSARHSHIMVEKKYRNRLNSQFERLLATLHDEDFIIDGDDVEGRRDFQDRRWSKAEVLDCARRYILALRADKKKLQAERKMLLENVDAAQ